MPGKPFLPELGKRISSQLHPHIAHPVIADKMNDFQRVQQLLTMTRQWHLFDAKEQDIDLVGDQAAKYLMGYHKPLQHEFTDCGDFVVVMNCKWVAQQGFNWRRREYYYYNGYPRTKVTIPAWKIHQADPCRLIFLRTMRSLRPSTARRMTLPRLFLFPEDWIHPEIKANIADQMEQTNKLVKKEIEYTEKDYANFPKLTNFFPGTIMHEDAEYKRLTAPEEKAKKLELKKNPIKRLPKKFPIEEIKELLAAEKAAQTQQYEAEKQAAEEERDSRLKAEQDALRLRRK